MAIEQPSRREAAGANRKTRSRKRRPRGLNDDAPTAGVDPKQRRRGRRAFALLVAAAAMGMAVPSLAATVPTTAQLTTRVVKKLPARGTYAVVVTLAKTKVQETADVYVGSQVQDNIPVAPWSGADAAFYVHVNAKKLKVRVVGTAAPVKFRVATARQTSAVTASQPAANSYSAAPRNGYHTLVWSDEFTGPAGSAPNPANWISDSGGGCGDNTLSTNTANLANASLDGAGDLAITALPVPGVPGTYSSAQLDTTGLHSFSYGRIEARMDLPAGQGLCSAFWMYQDNTTATGCGVACGEIDIMEQGGQDPFRISATLHGPIAPTPGDTNEQQWQSGVVSATPLAGSFHTYGLIWSPGKITWTLDGVPYATATPASLPKGATWVFDGHPFHIILDLAVGGYLGPPTPTTVFPATMSVAWVRVYQ
jgi:beta-glucanase (GH16 family)